MGCGGGEAGRNLARHFAKIDPLESSQKGIVMGCFEQIKAVFSIV
jgi:hypothetical protein